VTIDGSGFLPFNQNNVDLLDTAFNPGSGVDIWINSIILQANNKILISAILPNTTTFLEITLLG
jgi:hypothetical protein